MNKFVKVMDDTKSNAGGFEYKLDEVNISNNWNPNEFEPEKNHSSMFTNSFMEKTIIVKVVCKLRGVHFESNVLLQNIY